MLVARARRAPELQGEEAALEESPGQSMADYNYMTAWVEESRERAQAGLPAIRLT